MSHAANFRRFYEVGVATATTGAQVAGFIGAEADRVVADLVTRGSASRLYRRFVNGVENAANASVKLDGSGSISYQFSSLAECAGFALDYAISHSPERSGDFKRGWYLLVNTVPWTNTDLSAIPLGAEVTLSNPLPYARKIDVGGMRMNAAPQIIEQTRQAVFRKFPTIDAERIFITIPGGYVLKGWAYRSGISYDKKTKRYIQAHPRRQTRRADARKGELMTYPSLAMSETI